MAKTDWTIKTREDEVDFIFSHLKGQSDLNVLDIGCGEGDLLSKIYNRQGQNIKHIAGVDNADEDDVDIFNDDFVENHNSVVGNKEMPNNLAKFYRQDGFQYLQDLTVDHGIIIFSNVLHFYPWEKVKKIITLAGQRLSPDGIIYIQVANLKKEFKSAGKKYPFNANTIEEIKSFLHIKTLLETKSHYFLILTIE